MPEEPVKCFNRCGLDARFKVAGFPYCLRHAQIQLFRAVMKAQTLGDYPLVIDLRNLGLR